MKGEKLFAQGWYNKATAVASPNYNERPEGSAVKLLVIHNISLPPKEYGSGNIEAFFCNRLDSDAHPYFEEIKNLKVSAHFFIARTGNLTQFVNCEKRAWHAGVSVWKEQENCNDFSIGIELEGCDDEAYAEQQYECLASLVSDLLRQYALPKESVVGHSDIAPQRKTDPGASFDWLYFQELLDARL